MPPCTIATAAIRAVHDPAVNLQTILQTIEDAASQGAELLVLPEQALQGYLPSLTNYDLEHTTYQVNQAERISDGEGVGAIASQARKSGVHVVFGMTERDQWQPEVLYNTAVLVGPEGVLSAYRKVHQPGDEKHIYHPGDSFTVCDTPIGRIGLLICYDLVFPETTRSLALANCDLLVMPTAWAVADPHVDPQEDTMVDYLRLFTRVRALENQAWVVASNLIGTLGDFTYPGMSHIVGPDGSIRADTGPEGGIALVTADLKAEMVHARTVGYLGYNFLKDYVPTAPAQVVTGAHRIDHTLTTTEAS